MNKTVRFDTTLPLQRQSTAPTWVDARKLRELVPMSDAIDALDEAFSDPDGIDPPSPRSWFDAGDAQVAVMPAVGASGGLVKLVSVRESNASRGLPVIQGVYVIFDGSTFSPSALVGGAELTALRTPAVSAVATRHLARADASRLVVFGTGVQARAHVEAMLAVRPISSVVVVPRIRANADGFVADLVAAGLEARVGEPGDVAHADIVCTCTTSDAPLFDGADLPPGVHVNAMGSYKPDVRELDSTAVRRALLVVENREVSATDSGDVAIPISEGVITEKHIVGDLLSLNGDPVRKDTADITVFKSIGMAFEDKIIANALLRALARG